MIAKIYRLSAIAHEAGDDAAITKLEAVMSFISTLTEVDVSDADDMPLAVSPRVPYTTEPIDFDFAANIPHQRVDNHLVIASPIKR